MSKLRQAWALAALLGAAPAFAAPYELPYAGRLAGANGTPVEGPVTLRVTLSRTPDAGATTSLAPVDQTDVVLREGTFQIKIAIDDADFEMLFAPDGKAFLEVKDVTHGVTYPKQQILGVPFAQKVAPQKQLAFETDGGVRVVLKPAANSSPTTYELPPVPEAGRLLTTDGSGKLSWTPGLAEPLSSPLGLKTYASTPSGLAPADEGKMWYDGSTHVIKYWNGTAALSLGVGGGGLTQLNGLTDGSQGFGVPGTTGTAPNWVSASGVHTLNLPLASASGVTAGLLSRAEYDAFNGKLGLDGAGNLAIGTSTATERLTIDGGTSPLPARIVTTSNRSGLIIENRAQTGTLNSSDLRFIDWDGTAQSISGQISVFDNQTVSASRPPNSLAVVAPRANGVLQLMTGGVFNERMRIDSAPTTSPTTSTRAAPSPPRTAPTAPTTARRR